MTAAPGTPAGARERREPPLAPPPEPASRPLRRILCTIDFSEASVAAVAEAVALARACRGEVTVLFVIPLAVPSRADRPKAPAGLSSAVTEDVEALLEPARAAGIPVRVCLKAGRPAREILDEIRRTSPDVVVMGTHGRGGFRRCALGSVAGEVLRNAGCPILTIAHHRGAPPLPEQPRSDTVVCAVGLSPSSSRTVARAGDVARATGGHLTLLHVLAPAADRSEARRRLQALSAAQGLGGDRVEHAVVAGMPARQILRAASSRRAALVVVGGDGLAGGAPLGSIADRVIRGARCPVLTVRPEVAPS